MIYGHARVSTERQSADTQVRHTKSTGGCKMLREMASGAKIDCSRGRMVLAQLGAGDMLMVTKLDGLTRSISDLLTLGLDYRREGRLQVSRLHMDRHHHSQSRLMLTVLGGWAQFEHELIRARTVEGRAPSRGAWREDGKKAELTSHQQKYAIKRRDRGEASREIARSYNVRHSTISRWGAA